MNSKEYSRQGPDDCLVIRPLLDHLKRRSNKVKGILTGMSDLQLPRHLDAYFIEVMTFDENTADVVFEMSTYEANLGYPHDILSIIDLEKQFENFYMAKSSMTEGIDSIEIQPNCLPQRPRRLL